MLKDRLPLLPGIDDWNKRPAWIVEQFSPRKNPIVLRLLAPADISLHVSPVRAKASDVGKLKVKSFVKLLKAGVKPGEAAHRLHTTVKELMSKQEAQEQIRETIENFTFDASVRKLLSRAMANKLLLAADKEGDKKTVLDVMKIINADSEVGIDAPPQVAVNVGIDPALKEVLDRTVPIPKLEAPPVEADWEETTNEINKA